tara:strand:+ start:4016 stop:4198 length:183 start_codon:yes stop_codon:yes gene_type:complete
MFWRVGAIESCSGTKHQGMKQKKFFWLAFGMTLIIECMTYPLVLGFDYSEGSSTIDAAAC